MEILCKIRDLYRAIAEFESYFEEVYNLCLNEGMLLCSLAKADLLSSGELAEMLNLTTSNASKVIKSVEEKGLIIRKLGSKDKRQMYFSLTKKGKNKLDSILDERIDIPDILKKVI